MFDSVTLPFTSTEVLSNAMGFLGVIASLVLLGIAISLTPRIIAVIKSAIGRGGRNA